MIDRAVYRAARDLNVQDIMDAGLHIGHSWMKRTSKNVSYIMGTRQGLHIFDPSITLSHLRRASNFLNLVAKSNGIVCFVSNRKELDSLAVRAAKYSGSYYIPRFMSGTLTNSKLVLGSDSKPDVLVLLDLKRSIHVAAEARKSMVPTISITDCDVEPDTVSYHVPGNDDQLLGIKLFAEAMAQAIKEK